MALSQVANVRLAGLAACVPATEVSNLQLPHLKPDERAKLVKAIGIEKRRVVAPGQCASDLCHAAASRIMQELAWDPESIDALVFVSHTPDYILPATAVVLQHRLGLPQTCLAFNIGLGCSAYPYGLAVVSSLISAMKLRRALLLVGDAFSKITSPQDKSTSPIFGDAGSATALEWNEGSKPLWFDLASDGSGYQAIMIPDGSLGGRNPIQHQSLDYIHCGEGIVRSRCHLTLDGLEVFNFSVREVPKTVTRLMGAAAVTENDIDTFVFHQANLLMNEMIRKKLKIPPEKAPSTLHEFGNTSCATIPVTLVARERERLAAGNLTALLCGYGVGLSWATALIRFDGITCPEMIVL